MRIPSSATIQQCLDATLDWLKIISLLAAIFVLIPLIVWNQFQPTYAQEEYAKKEKRSVNDIITRACEVRADCQALGTAQLECATAGDIDRCIRIKVPILAGLPYCSGREALVFPEHIRPTALQCWRYH